jgi:hypothetical protein
VVKTYKLLGTPKILAQTDPRQSVESSNKNSFSKELKAVYLSRLEAIKNKKSFKEEEEEEKK